MKKNHQNQNIYKAFWALPILLLPVLASAFSVTGFLSSFLNGTPTVNKAINDHENLQNLKVFESNKSFAQTNSNIAPTNKIVDDNSTSFQVPDNLVDDLGSSSEGQSDNAIYTVQKGDSIGSIASYFGVSVQTIMTFNHKDTRTVHVGDVLEIPSQSGVLYTVGKNDTLAKIAKKYSIDVDDITLYNGLLSSDDVSPGDEIFLPGAKESAEDIKNSSLKTGKGKNILANKSGHWEKGDTAHLNTIADINKYSSLPKYPGYYIMPSPGAVRTQKMHGHNGVDLANKLGSPILASAGGIVRVAKTGGYNFGYGNYIIITHPNGTETVYGHLLQVNVSVGQHVDQGQVIGLLGSTGNSTGPHVHFEIRGGYNPWAW